VESGGNLGALFCFDKSRAAAGVTRNMGRSSPGAI